MGTPLYWVHGLWPGKLALAARPRGSDWLEDEMISWKRAGVNTVLSLLEKAEERELGLADEGNQIRRQGMKFISLPIPDRQVPNSESELTTILEELNADLLSGKNVVVHCRQGVGRTGLVAACLLITKGLTPEIAIMKIRDARGTVVPETDEQRNWINHYASVLPSTK